MKNMRGQSTGAVIGIIVIIIIIVGGAWWYLSMTPPPGTAPSSADAQAVDAAVVGFGGELQQVSLMASSSAVIAAMQQNYAQYVSPELMNQWEASPTSSPGRLTSSPWPDHIDVVGTVQNANGSYTVTGNVVEMTSTGEAGSYPITATLSNQSGSWLIVSWSGYPPANQAASSTIPQ